MNPLLEITGLEMSLGARRILDIDRIALQPGELTVLSGPNGAGKTTLLKIMAGLLRPDRAQVRLAGQTGSWRRVRGELRRHTVYLHQHPYLFRSSVADNAAYGLRRKGVARGEIRARVHEALDWAGLAALAGQDARCLSGGEMQRLALCRARLLGPKLMLLDEPVSNMDPEHRAQTYALLKELCEEGIGLMMTSHDLDTAERLGHRHLCLRDGHLAPCPKASSEAAPQQRLRPVAAG
jgi:tungstate transport system ATP-binding protein